MTDNSIKQQVLEAVRGLAACGLGPNIGGHVSVRVPGERLFHINVFDRSSDNTVQFVMPDMIRHPWIAGQACNDMGKANSIAIGDHPA